MKAGHLYVGQAGQFAVMAELAWRGHHAVTPGVDVGDDIFVLSDADGTMSRIQVKTSKEKRQKTSSKYSFKIKQAAIQNAQSPDLHFVFAMRRERKSGWRFLVMTRRDIQTHVIRYNIGTPSDKGTFLRIDVTLHDDGSAICSGHDWREHLENWEPWPHRRLTPIKKQSNRAPKEVP